MLSDQETNKMHDARYDTAISEVSPLPIQTRHGAKSIPPKKVTEVSKDFQSTENLKIMPANNHTFVYLAGG